MNQNKCPGCGKQLEFSFTIINDYDEWCNKKVITTFHCLNKKCKWSEAK